MGVNLGAMPEMLESAQVARMAAESGFDLCGFARAEPIPPSVLLDWLEAGMDADMDWMRERVAERLDVGRLLSGARTVVALACNYYWDERPSPVSRYARGRDYHHTMRDRLKALRRRLVSAWPGLETYACVDTGPVMEKVWAARAGLGYVGRNGCFITERYGSFVVLAAMVLDREVDAYAAGPAEDRCGSCNLCVNACPTLALMGDGRVDARRCLSYQTIENRSEVPDELRDAFADIVFGCDVCQEVCPLNDAPVRAGPRFAPRAVSSLTAKDIAALSRERYEEAVRGTALGRAKYDGLRRNAIYALGASGDRTALPLLERLAGDESELVREAARWAIRRLTP